MKDETPATPPPRSLPDLLLGLVGGAMVVAAAVVLLFGGPRDSGAAPAAFTAPSLRIAEPAAGDTIDGALAIVFESAAELQRSPAGWGAAGLHLHLDVDGREFMPAGTDIARLGAGRYRWTVHGLPPGSAPSLRLFWAGADHRPMREGASTPVRVHVR